MNIIDNIPELYQERINELRNQFDNAKSRVLREEISNCYLLTNAAVTAYADLQLSLNNLPALYIKEDEKHQARLNEITEEMTTIVSEARERNDKEDLLLSFEILKKEVESIHSIQDFNSKKNELLLQLGVNWVNLIGTVFLERNFSLLKKKLSFLAKTVNSQIPVIGPTIDFLILMSEAMTIHIKDIKTTDSTLKDMENYKTSLQLYVYGCVGFRLDCDSIFNMQPLLADTDKHAAIEQHYLDVIAGHHRLLKK